MGGPTEAIQTSGGRAWLSPRASETTQVALDMQGSLFHPTISRMGSTQPTSPSLLISPSRPSPVDLQAHLYTSLLEGHTADVILRIRGSWEAIYKLHRVVLIQAGFFRSLFTNGFAETHRGSSHAQDELVVVFDDPNITRAAFELCISRLYGGGPPLHIEPSLVPSLSQPLTSGYPVQPKATPLPVGHHPATPRILLSLIATAVYLSIPAVASQALAAVLASVGPHTVVRYLNFACGKGIGPAGDDEPEAAVGLEELAKSVRKDEAPFILGSPAVLITPPVASSPSVTAESLPSDDTHDSCTTDSHRLDVQKEGPSDTGSEELNESMDQEPDNEPSYEYGAVSSKIGEAVACWLARWGGDIFAHEQNAFSNSPPVIPSLVKRRATVSTQPTAMDVDTAPPQLVPKIWCRGGLNAKWAAAVLSSDLLFVRAERERYDLAKGVVELRRQEGELQDEEAEWANLFTHGIYYANMLLEDLTFIAHDVSPSTRKPYVPLSVIQASHWDQSLLQHRITVRPSSASAGSPPSSPTPLDKELGIVKTTSDLLQDITGETARSSGLAAVYHPVPVDSSSRVGDASGLESATMEELFDMPAPNTEKRKAGRTCFRESSFFGLASERHRAEECVAKDSSGKARWTPHAPFRFAVEFWAVDALREKSRLHSHTIWYAGSLFNVYVQVVRKKGIQLGVYLHRQSTIDPLPPVSAPAPPPVPLAARSHMHRPSLPERELSTSASMPIIHRTATSTTPRSTTPRSTTPRSQTPVSTSRSAFVGASSAPDTDAPVPASTFPATAQALAPVQPYRDPRSAVSAYFTIACQSATGSSLTRFSSAPDVFSVSQSWGWKSSSLRTEEYLEVSEEGATGHVSRAKEVSLRATVVLGLV